MVHGKIITEKSKIKEVHEILGEVFVKELQYKEEDIVKYLLKQTHYVLLYEGISDDCPVACGCLFLNESIANISLIAVKKKFRGKMYGDLAIRMLIDKAITLDFTNIYTNIPINLMSMFEKIGFYKVTDSSKYNLEDGKFIVNNPIRLKYNMKMWNSCQNNHHNVD